MWVVAAQASNWVCSQCLQRGGAHKAILRQNPSAIRSAIIRQDSTLGTRCTDSSIKRVVCRRHDFVVYIICKHTKYGSILYILLLRLTAVLGSHTYFYYLQQYRVQQYTAVVYKNTRYHTHKLVLCIVRMYKTGINQIHGSAEKTKTKQGATSTDRRPSPFPRHGGKSAQATTSAQPFSGVLHDEHTAQPLGTRCRC